MYQQLLALGGIGLISGIAALTSTPTAPVGLEDGAYAIDAVHSSVLFSATHLGVSRFYGRFNEISGELSFDPENPTDAKINVEIAADSVDTNDGKRDQHLSGPDFFSAKEFKTLGFESTAVKVKSEATDDEPLLLEVTGMLDMVGKKRSVTAIVELVGAGKGMRGGELIGFHTTFEIQRSEWGMETMIGPLSDAIQVTISLEAAR
jgi:polyisoprenoid-binding protein YceI